LVRYKLGAKLKVARRSHPRNADAIAALRHSFAAQLQTGLPSGTPRQVAGWAMDERRSGLQPIRRRRITACGTTPVGACQHRCETF